jgi:hypothetical protein
VRKWFTRRALLLHLTVCTVVPTFLGLAWWQLHRALGGNDLSWAYTFEWPFFAGYAVFVWWKLVHDQPVRGRARSTAPAAPVERPVGWALTNRRTTQPVPALAGAANIGGSAVDVPASVPAPDPVSSSASTHEPGDSSGPLTEQQRRALEEEAALAEYNEYLAALAASGRRKRW